MWGSNKIIWKSGSPNSVGRGAVNSNNEIIPELEFQQKRIKDGVAKRCGEWNHVITKIPEVKKPPVFEKKEGWLFISGYLPAGEKRALSHYVGELFYDEVNEIFTDKWAAAPAWTLSDSVVSRRISEDARYVGEAFVDPNWDNTVYGGVEWSMYEPLYDGTKELVFNQEATVSTEDWREKLLFNETDYLILAPFPCGIDYLKRFDYQSLTKSSYDKTRDSAYYQKVAKDFFEPQVSSHYFYKKNAFGNGNIYRCKHCGKFMATPDASFKKEENKTVGVAFEINRSDDERFYISYFNNEKEATNAEIFLGYYDSRETFLGANTTQNYIKAVDDSKTLGAYEKLNNELPRLHSKQSDIYLLLSSNDFDVTQYEYNPFFSIGLGDSNFNYSNYEITLDCINPVIPNLKKRKAIKDYNFNKYFKKNKISFFSFKKLISYNESNSRNFYNIDKSFLPTEQYFTNNYIYNIFSGDAEMYVAPGNYSSSTCTIDSTYDYAKRPLLYYDLGHQRTRTFTYNGITETREETQKGLYYVSPIDLLYYHGLDISQAKLEYKTTYHFEEIKSTTAKQMSYSPQKFTFSSLKLKKINENASPVKSLGTNPSLDVVEIKLEELPPGFNIIRRITEGVEEVKKEECKLSVYQINKDGTCKIRVESV